MLASLVKSPTMLADVANCTDPTRMPVSSGMVSMNAGRNCINDSQPDARIESELSNITTRLICETFS